MNERIQRFILTLSAPKALYWPTFSLACSMSSSGSDGNIAVIHLCFPLLVRHQKGQLEQRLLIHPVWTEADSLMTPQWRSVTHSVCDLSRIWCFSCWPSHSCRWKMKPEMPCSFWLRSFTFSSPILACTNTMNFHVLQKEMSFYYQHHQQIVHVSFFPHS